MTDPLTDTTDGAPSQTAVDALLSALTNLIAGASTPESQQAQTLLLQRLALEGSVIPSRIPPPANITQVGGYINLLTSLGESDLRSQLLGAALGLAGSTPLPGLAEPAPALPLVPMANDRGGDAVPVTVSLRSDMVAGLAVALDAVHRAGGLLPLWSPSALPPAGSTVALDLLVYLGRAVLIAPTVTLVDPQSDPVVLGRAASDPGTGYRLAVRVNAGTPGASTEDWTCLLGDQTSGTFVTQTVTGASMLPIETALAGSGLSAAQVPTAPIDRADLSWARLAALGGLIPSVTRLGDELALVYPAAQITGSALAPLADWTWDGTRFAPPA
jgi:hypothetical protein